MIKTKKITKMFCDYCGNECIDSNKERYHYLGGNNDVVQKIHVRISYYGSYQTTDGDVCNECAKKALRKIINEL